MTLQADVQRFRQDFDLWRLRGERLGQRLTQLETQLASEREIPKAETSEAPREPAAPPPIPECVKVPESTSRPLLVAKTAGEQPVSTPKEQSSAPSSHPVPDTTVSICKETVKEPSLLAKGINRIKRMGPKEDMSWEMALGTYWLPRVAIVLVVMGIVGVLIVAVEKFHNATWAPHARVGLGYLSCVILLGLGKYLENKNRAFARILLAGGFAISYFVTFATYFIPFARIVSTPTPTLIALGCIVFAWGYVAQIRRSHLIALGVTLLGHLTVALTSLEISSSVGGVGALLLLAAGSAFFLLRNSWYYVAAAGLLGSHFNYALWLFTGKGGDTVLDFSIAMAIAAAFFLIFALAELFAPAGLRCRAIPLRWRTSYVSFNTGAFLIIGLILMRGFDFTRDQFHYFYWTQGAVLLVLGTAYATFRKRDPLFNAYFTKSMALVSLGFAAYFDGNMLTLALAIQACTLLAAARIFGFTVNRILAIAVALLALWSGLYDFSQLHAAGALGSNLWDTLPGLIAMVALLGIAFLDQYTTWRSVEKYMPNELWVGLPPYLFSVIAIILVVASSYIYVPKHEHAWLFSSGALVLVLAGGAVGMRPWIVASFLPSVAAFCLIESFEGSNVLPRTYTDEGYVLAVLRVAVTILPMLVLSELSRTHRCARENSWPEVTLVDSLRRVDGLPFVYALAGATLFFGSTYYLAAPEHHFAVLAAGALALSAYATLIPTLALGIAGLGLFTAAVLAGFTNSGTWTQGAVLLALAAFLSEYRYLGRRPGLYFHQLTAAPYLLYSAAVYFAALRINEDFGATGMLLLAIAAGISMKVLHTRAFAYITTAVYIWSAILWVMKDSGAISWNALGIILPVMGVSTERFINFLRNEKRDLPGVALLITVWFILLYYTQLRIDFPWYFTNWSMIAVGFLVYAAVTRVRTAAILSVLAGILTAMTFLIDGRPSSQVGATPIWIGLLAIATYGVLLERAHAQFEWNWGKSRAPKIQRRINILLVAAPCGFVALLLHRFDVQLTIAWTVMALALYGISFAVRQPWYRYAGLVVFGLAILRAVFVDTQALDWLSRTLALILLGSVLLAVGYAYTRVREHSRKAGTLPDDVDQGVEHPVSDRDDTGTRLESTLEDDK